jgi:hypothetical protein
VSAHWIRHTTLTGVERNFGFATTHAYAGHFDEGDNKNATLTYVKAIAHDIATALSALTGEPHLLDTRQPDRYQNISHPVPVPVPPGE